MSPGRLRDVDSAQRARIVAIAIKSLPGGLIGAMGSSFGGLGALSGFIVGWGVAFGAVFFFSEWAGTAFQQIHAPSGSSTPHRTEYSRPRALALRGAFEEAVTAWEAAVGEFPADPTPYVELARLYRDHLKQPDLAVHWFKRARTDAHPDPRLDLLISEEVIELYSGRLGQPARAIPELARLADRFPESEAGRRARERLLALRRSQFEGGES